MYIAVAKVCITSLACRLALARSWSTVCILKACSFLTHVAEKRGKGLLCGAPCEPPPVKRCTTSVRLSVRPVPPKKTESLPNDDRLTELTNLKKRRHIKFGTPKHTETIHADMLTGTD